MTTLPVTTRGAELLKAELHQLKSVERPAIINAIAEARAQGDLSENAEYEAAKDRQGFIEGRIKDIEGKLAAALVIDPDVSLSVMFFPKYSYFRSARVEPSKLPEMTTQRGGQRLSRLPSPALPSAAW